MKVFYGFDRLPSFGHAAATVGSYDGVHDGHRVLLDRVAEQARRSGGESIVLTFDPHPRITLGTQEGLRLLSSIGEKRCLLERLGIDNLIVIPFDRAFSRIPSEVFLREYLIGRVGVENLVVGFNHRFGRDKEGDYRQLAALHEKFGFRVTEVAEYDIDAERVSSTLIRRLILAGEMERAARMLGHPYLLAGSVGADGRVVPEEPLKLLPPEGRYPVRVGEQEAVLRIGSDGGPRLEWPGGALPTGERMIIFR